MTAKFAPDAAIHDHLPDAGRASPTTAYHRSTMPLYFLTPEGRPVTPRRMGAALRQIRRAPDAEYPGWNWFPTQGWAILAEFRRGMHDRINRRTASCPGRTASCPGRAV